VKHINKGAVSSIIHSRGKLISLKYRLQGQQI